MPRARNCVTQPSVSAVPAPRRRARAATPSAPIQPVVPNEATPHHRRSRRPSSRPARRRSRGGAGTRAAARRWRRGRRRAGRPPSESISSARTGRTSRLIRPARLPRPSRRAPLLPPVRCGGSSGDAAGRGVCDLRLARDRGVRGRRRLRHVDDAHLVRGHDDHAADPDGARSAAGILEGRAVRPRTDTRVIRTWVDTLRRGDITAWREAVRAARARAVHARATSRCGSRCVATHGRSTGSCPAGPSCCAPSAAVVTRSGSSAWSSASAPTATVRAPSWRRRSSSATG